MSIMAAQSKPVSSGLILAGHLRAEGTNKLSLCNNTAWRFQVEFRASVKTTTNYGFDKCCSHRNDSKNKIIMLNDVQNKD
ncbi:hypothetical protein ANCCAN_11081 [Ancylostoma caninum]|uniref:Uncharacterized protein n=1 Tax=Ancylostoma caninum TaxID=29170 RepID=A0A368GJC9_ANCCA|nr:hypothetical protein ANCCAN_11081 [Ancylostoma caninum]